MKRNVVGRKRLAELIALSRYITYLYIGTSKHNFKGMCGDVSAVLSAIAGELYGAKFALIDAYIMHGNIIGEQHYLNIYNGNLIDASISQFGYDPYSSPISPEHYRVRDICIYEPDPMLILYALDNCKRLQKAPEFRKYMKQDKKACRVLKHGGMQHLFVMRN